MNNNILTIQKLQLIWVAVFSSALTFALIAAYFVADNVTPISSEQNYMTAIAAFLCLSCTLAAYILFGRRVSAVDVNADPVEKLSAYTAAFIVKIALFEAPALFSIIAFILGHDSTVLILTGLMILVMILNFPSASKIGSALSLTDEDLDRLRGKSES